MSNIPDTQRSWVVVRQGKPNKALELKENWPVPKQLAPGQVLVRVQAAALNPVGWKVMRALPTLLSRRPHPAEHDFSGVVVDANGSKYAKGDNVYGWVPTDLQFKTKEGVLTHYLRVHEDYIVKRPDNITPTQASGITLTAMTAYQGLELAKLEAEQTILVNGGSSSVGAMAIQIAKARGAKVYATASAKNEEYVRKLGADVFIDYTKEPLVKQLTNNPPSPKFHVIYDAVGLVDPSLFTHSAKYLAPSGIFLSTGPLPHGWGDAWNVVRTFGAMLIPSLLGNVNRKYALPFVTNKAADMEEIRKLVANGSVKPVVDSVFEFDDALKAYDRILTLRATGKVVVKVDPTAE